MVFTLKNKTKLEVTVETQGLIYNIGFALISMFMSNISDENCHFHSNTLTLNHFQAQSVSHCTIMFVIVILSLNIILPRASYLLIPPNNPLILLALAFSLPFLAYQSLPSQRSLRDNGQKVLKQPATQRNPPRHTVQITLL